MTAFTFNFAVKLRLGEIRAGQIPYFVGVAQFPDLSLQPLPLGDLPWVKSFFDALLVGRGRRQADLHAACAHEMLACLQLTAARESQARCT
jgi:hypothetical protein